MKVILTKKLKSIEGKVMLINPSDAKSEATLQKIIPIILLGTYKGDDSIGAEEKLARYNLANKVANSTKAEIDLTAEEIVHIKKLAGIGCDAQTLGQLHEHLPK